MEVPFRQIDILQSIVRNATFFLLLIKLLFRSLSLNLSTLTDTPLHLLEFEIDKRFEFPRRRLVLEETLGEGEFGLVVAGRALDATGSGYTKVAVKMLKSFYSQYELQVLIFHTLSKL